MAHFAKVEDGTVTEVIVAEQDFIDSLPEETGVTWVQTSYNTYGGTHKNDGAPLRKNFAGIGYTYDADKDAFISPKPYPSWTLNEETCLWQAPTEAPDGDYSWDEDSQAWVSLSS